MKPNPLVPWIAIAGLCGVAYLLQTKKGTDALLNTLALAAAGQLGQLVFQGIQNQN
jgi:hypothetical protein